MYSLGTLVAGLSMGVIGRLFDKQGHRVMTTIIALGFGLALLGMSFVNSLILLFAGFMAIRMLGQGSLGLSSSTLPPQWFITKKGKALSLVSLGGAISSALLPPLNTWLIQNYGWRFGWRFWGFLLMITMAPIAYFFIRDRPEKVGLLPDNIMNQSKQMEAELNNEINWTVNEAIRTRTFWLLLYCSIVPSALSTGLVFHHVSIMDQIGVSSMGAALVLSVTALVGIPIVLVAGIIADKVAPRYLYAIAEGALFGAILLLLFFTNSATSALIYGALLGVSNGLTMILGRFIWPDYYGRKNLSSIKGVTMMSGIIGTALGPMPLGVGFDMFGSYHEVLLISMIFPLLAIIAAMLAKPPQKNEKLNISKNNS